MTIEQARIDNWINTVRTDDPTPVLPHEAYSAYLTWASAHRLAWVGRNTFYAELRKQLAYTETPRLRFMGIKVPTATSINRA